MVRASWDHKRERKTEYWSGDTSSEAILPTLLLERLIDGVLQSGERTHIASRRESLCSSWPAARKSLIDVAASLARTPAGSRAFQCCGGKPGRS